MIIYPIFLIYFIIGKPEPHMNILFRKYSFTWILKSVQVIMLLKPEISQSSSKFSKDVHEYTTKFLKYSAVKY